MEIVVVDKQSVEFQIEELRRNRAGEFIVPNIDKFQRREAEENGGEFAGEDIVTDIDLV